MKRGASRIAEQKTAPPETVMTRTLTLPLRVVSESNQRDHWAAKARRVKAQRQAVAYAWVAADLPMHRRPRQVTLTRVAPRRLDDDNLARSLKAVRDQVAQECGFDDREPVRWIYAQERGSYAVRIEVSW